MGADNNHIMTLKELAEYLRVHPMTVYHEVKCGRLPGFKVGSGWRFDRASIDRWCLAQDSASMAAGGERKLKLVRKGAGALA
jgi:excisionase family DNA binding protein